MIDYQQTSTNINKHSQTLNSYTLDALLIIEAREVAGAHGHGVRVASHPGEEMAIRRIWAKSGKHMGKIWEHVGKWENVGTYEENVRNMWVKEANPLVSLAKFSTPSSHSTHLKIQNSAIYP